MKLSILSNKIPWFGKYSGYDCIDQYFPTSLTCKTYLASDTSFSKKLVGRLYQYKYSLKNVAPNVLTNGVRFLNEVGSDTVSHVLYVDANRYILKIAKEDQFKNLAGTVHLPFGQWKEDGLEKLAPLQHALILYDSEVDKFQPYLPHAKLHVIKHGVDNAFFKPGNVMRDKTKLLCVGHYLRNFPMLERVIAKLSFKSKSLSFHLMIPTSFRTHPSLIALANYTNVFFYEKLSDEELLSLYQMCGAMLMPMDDSGANTAIVQAIACGIPLITTNTGGITSYGGNNVYELVENNDDEAMVNLTLRYVDDRKFADNCSIQMREFSLKYLDWFDIANQHYEYYQQILKQ